MPHGQYCDLAAIVPVEHDIAAVPELDEPLAEFVRHFVDRSPNFGVRTKRFDSLTDRANRTSCSIAVSRREETMNARDIAQSRGSPNNRRHRSSVGERWL
jgi:hypothetical protein